MICPNCYPKTMRPGDCEGPPNCLYPPSPMGRYRKRPVEIDAIQALPENLAFILGLPGVRKVDRPGLPGFNLDWCDSHPQESDGGNTCPDPLCVSGSFCVVVETPHALALLEPRQWLIRGVVGELYPCDPDVFAQTYQSVDDAG